MAARTVRNAPHVLRQTHYTATQCHTNNYVRRSRTSHGHRAVSDHPCSDEKQDRHSTGHKAASRPCAPLSTTFQMGISVLGTPEYLVASHFYQAVRCGTVAVGGARAPHTEFIVFAATRVTHSRPSGPPQESPGYHKAPLYTNQQRGQKVGFFSLKQKTSAYISGFGRFL